MGTVIKEGLSEALTFEIKYESREGAWEDLGKGCSLAETSGQTVRGLSESERCLVGPGTVRV